MALKERNVKVGAFVALGIMQLYILSQLLQVFQTQHLLVSPIIPDTIVWEINKQFVFKALIASVITIIGLPLYFYRKYIYVIILVLLSLITSRFIYI